MVISLIVAMDRNRGIGRNGEVPWRLSTDMAFFKNMTMGKPIIMGRKTWASLGRALPGRKNIVLSRSPDFQADGAMVVRQPEAALEAAGDVEEVVVIGGAEIYQLFLPTASQIYLTQVNTLVEDADTHFPDFDLSAWDEEMLGIYPRDADNSNDFSISVLRRRAIGS